MKHVFLTPVSVKDGHYTGSMSGHTIKWVYEGTHIQCETELGIRGINVEVSFDIRDNRVVESSITPTEKQP